MGRETVLFKSEEPKTSAEVAAFLRLLADKVSDGQVILKQGATELALDIPNNVVLEIKAEEELNKQGVKKLSLEVEIEWREGANDTAAGPVTLG